MLVQVPQLQMPPFLASRGLWTLWTLSLRGLLPLVAGLVLLPRPAAILLLLNGALLCAAIVCDCREDPSGADLPPARGLPDDRVRARAQKERRSAAAECLLQLASLAALCLLVLLPPLSESAGDDAASGAAFWLSAAYSAASIAVLSLRAPCHLAALLAARGAGAPPHLRAATQLSAGGIRALYAMLGRANGALAVPLGVAAALSSRASAFENSGPAGRALLALRLLCLAHLAVACGTFCAVRLGLARVAAASSRQDLHARARDRALLLLCTALGAFAALALHAGGAAALLALAGRLPGGARAGGALGLAAGCSGAFVVLSHLLNLFLSCSAAGEGVLQGVYGTLLRADLVPHLPHWLRLPHGRASLPPSWAMLPWAPAAALAPLLLLPPALRGLTSGLEASCRALPLALALQLGLALLGALLAPLVRVPEVLCHRGGIRAALAAALAHRALVLLGAAAALVLCGALPPGCGAPGLRASVRTHAMLCWLSPLLSWLETARRAASPRLRGQLWQLLGFRRPYIDAREARRAAAATTLELSAPTAAFAGAAFLVAVALGLSATPLGEAWVQDLDGAPRGAARRGAQALLLVALFALGAVPSLAGLLALRCRLQGPVYLPLPQWVRARGTTALSGVDLLAVLQAVLGLCLGVSLLAAPPPGRARHAAAAAASLLLFAVCAAALQGLRRAGDNDQALAAAYQGALVEMSRLDAGGIGGGGGGEEDLEAQLVPGVGLSWAELLSEEGLGLGVGGRRGAGGGWGCGCARSTAPAPCSGCCSRTPARRRPRGVRGGPPTPPPPPPPPPTPRRDPPRPARRSGACAGCAS